MLYTARERTWRLFNPFSSATPIGAAIVMLTNMADRIQTIFIVEAEWNLLNT